jgi:RND family efflux transporter MFP subunit
VEITKNEGDVVQAGDVLVRFEVPAIAAEVATRQVELNDATMRMERAKAEADRQAGLFEKGLTPRNTWEASRTALAAAESNLGQVRARFDAAKALEAGMVVRASFPGVVAKRWHMAGDTVPGGAADPIMRVVDPTRLQIAARVPTTDSGRIQPGQTATVLTTAGSEPALVAMKIGPASSASTVEIRVNFLAPTTLPIDTPVQVDIAVEERKDVIVVPADAVQRVDAATFVWVPSDSSQATRREVRLGLVVNNLAQIVSGLNAGELVIVTGIAQLNEGTPITIGKTDK